MAKARDREDLLFGRYQRSGDPDLLAEVFDRTAPRLLRVAIHLTRDPAAAEDLVQAAFVTAIEKADQYLPGRPVLPWLTGILEKHAREFRNAASRRIAPDRVRLRPVATPPEQVESEELDEAVARALDQLPAPYRPVMVLKLRHGLKPAQIADALGRSPGAVRVQIHRGTEMLRQSLPIGLALSSVLCVTPTRGLAAMRLELRRHAAAQCSLAAKAFWIGQLAMKKTTTTALLAIALITGAGLYFVADPTPDSLTGTAGAETFASPTSFTRAVADGGDARGAAGGSDRSAIAGGPSIEGGGILVRVLWSDDRSPASGVGLTLRPHDGRHPDLHTERRVTPRDGAVLFDRLEPGQYGVYVDRDAKRVDEADARERLGVELLTEGALESTRVWSLARTANGVVLDQGGQFNFNLPQIRTVQTYYELTAEQGLDAAWVLPEGIASPEEEPEAVRSLEDLRKLLNELHASSRLPDEEPFAVETVRDEVVYVDVLVDRGVAVSGKVLDPDDRPVAGAVIWASGESKGDAHVLGRCEEDGSFRIESLAPGSKVWARARGFLPSGSIELENEQRDVTLRFSERAAAVVARVVDHRGTAVSGASVRFGDPVDGTKPTQLRTDAAGRVETDGLKLGEMPVLVLAAGYQPYRELLQVLPTDGEQAERVFMLDPGWVIEGTLRDHEGAGQKGVTIYAEAEGRATTEVTTGPDGAFELECLPPGPVTIRVPEGDHRELVRLVSGAAAEVQHHDLVLPPWGRIAGRIADPQGRPLERWRIRAVPLNDAGKLRSAQSDGDGKFSIETEPDVRYRLEAHPAHSQSFTIHTENGAARFVGAFVSIDLANGASRDGPAGRRVIPLSWLGDVRGVREDLAVVIPADLVPSATVRGRLTDAVGSPLTGSIRVHVDGRSRRVRFGDDGAFDIGPLIPGDYAFQVVSKGRSFPSFYLDVHALAPHAELDLGTIVPPASGWLDVDCVDARAERDAVGARVLDSLGRELASLKAVGASPKRVMLPVGHHTVELVAGGEVLATRQASIVAGEPARVSVELR